MMKQLSCTLFISLYVLISFTVSGQERVFYLKGTAPFGIYSSNLDGSDEVLVTTGVTNGARCAIKSGKIYYISGSSIKRINLDGTGQTVIPNTNDAEGEVSISASGDKLVYGGGAYNYQMIIIDTNGMNKTLWNNGAPNSIHQTGPSWNTVGTIFFVQSNLGNAYTQKIYSKPDNNPAAAPVLLTPSFAHEPNSGGPDNLVLFNDLSGNLITMNPDGSNPVVLSTAGGGNYAKGAWRLSDSTFYYIHSNNIWKIKYNNTGNTQITTAGSIERVIGFGVLSPTFTITASANPVCQGNPVTFTASETGSLATGSLQWYVNGVPVQTGNVTNGLVAWYPFTGNASDLSGFGHHGTVSGATLTSDRFGNANKAYAFDGINDFIKINPSPVLDIRYGLTLSAWFHADPANLNGQTQITWRGDPQGGYDPYSICFTNSGYLAFRRDVSPGNTMNQITSPASAIDLNQWHHVAGTYDSATGAMKLYLDGVLKTQQTLPGTAGFPTNTFWNMIGGVDNGYGQNFKGSLDDVRIYRRALSGNEILSLIQNFDTTFTYIPQNGDTVYCVYTSAGSPTVTDTSSFIIMQVNALPADIGESTGMGPLNGLVAWYPFNGNANDQSGNNNHGIYHGTLPTADPCGNAGMAAGFNGSSDWIEVPNSPTLQSPTNAITIATWVKSTFPYIPFLCKINGPSYNVYQFRTLFNLNNHICTYGMNGQDFNSTMNSSPGMNNWFHYAVTYDGSLVKFYINGVADHEFSLTGGLLPNSERLEIGRDAHGPIEWLSGAMDDLRLYNRALTLPEIVSLQTGCQFLMVDCTNDSICEGSTANIRVIHSQPSIQYQLLQNGINFGPPQTGNGDTLTFPITGLTATSGFTIHALNPATGCNRMLDTTLTVTVVPFVPTTSPDTSVCSGNNAVLQAFGGTNYLWSNGMTGSPITVAPLATTTYYVSVTNAEGCSGLDSVLVTILPGPQPTISGQVSICLGTNNAVYTTETGMSNYTWTITGGTITAGAGTPSVTVTWNTLGAQSMAVNYANAQGCMAATATSLAVTVNPMAAPVISGSNNMCVNSGYYYYSTQTGMNNYQWSVSPGATIIWGLGTPDLIVTWDQPGPQWVKVNYTNSSGCTAIAPTQFNVTVNPLPGVAGTITGPTTVCAGSNGVAFSTSLIPNAVTYVWLLPPGASVASGAGTNAITVDFATTAQSGTISVYGNNLCGNGSLSAPLTLSVGALPGLAGIPVGLDDVCEGDTGIVYYIPPVFNAASYIWDIQGGGVITAGNGTNSIRAKFPVAPAECQITVYGTNACGQGQISPVKEATVHATPETPTISQNGDMLVSSAPAGNQWFLNSAIIPNATQQTYAPIVTGHYSVQVTLEGCPSERSDAYYYIMTGTESLSQAQVLVYPVPNDGRFRVSWSGMKKEPTRIAIVNALGVTIDQREALSLLGEYQSEFDLRPVVPGVYTMVIENSSSRITRKLIIQ